MPSDSSERDEPEGPSRRGSQSSSWSRGDPPDGDVDLPSSVDLRARAPFRVFGAKRGHAGATRLADGAHGLLVRYATEVVARYRLCPFLHGVDSGLGAVGVMLDVELDVDSALYAIGALAQPVLHLVFPLYGGSATLFERFGSRLAEAHRTLRREPLVHASFHPDMTGGRENAHRLIGLLRQSPDPFVQFIPPGLQQGGTVLAGEDVPAANHAEARFDRLMKDGGNAVDEVLAVIEALKRERATYAALAESIANQ